MKRLVLVMVLFACVLGCEKERPFMTITACKQCDRVVQWEGYTVEIDTLCPRCGTNLIPTELGSGIRIKMRKETKSEREIRNRNIGRWPVDVSEFDSSYRSPADIPEWE